MKNIHILPTDKPSRLHTYKGVLNLAADEFVSSTDDVELIDFVENDVSKKYGIVPTLASPSCFERLS